MTHPAHATTLTDPVRGMSVHPTTPWTTEHDGTALILVPIVAATASATTRPASSRSQPIRPRPPRPVRPQMARPPSGLVRCTPRSADLVRGRARSADGPGAGHRHRRHRSQPGTCRHDPPLLGGTTLTIPIVILEMGRHFIPFLHDLIAARTPPSGSNSSWPRRWCCGRGGPSSCVAGPRSAPAT